jgi:hypothetical protein
MDDWVPTTSQNETQPPASQLAPSSPASAAPRIDMGMEDDSGLDWARAASNTQRRIVAHRFRPMGGAEFFVEFLDSKKPSAWQTYSRFRQAYTVVLDYKRRNPAPFLSGELRLPPHPSTMKAVKLRWRQRARGETPSPLPPRRMSSAGKATSTAGRPAPVAVPKKATPAPPLAARSTRATRAADPQPPAPVAVAVPTPTPTSATALAATTAASSTASGTAAAADDDESVSDLEEMILDCLRDPTFVDFTRQVASIFVAQLL